MVMKGFGSVPLYNGSGSGRHKNLRIRNTGVKVDVYPTVQTMYSHRTWKSARTKSQQDEEKTSFYVRKLRPDC